MEKTRTPSEQRRRAQAQAVIDEHKGLHALLERIDASLASPPSASSAAPWLADLHFRLGELVPQLEKHFAHEEECGLFDEIEDAMPEAAHTCAELLHDHRRLVDAVDALRARVGVASADDQAIAATAEKGRSLIRELAHHEAVEDELLFKALEGGIAAQD